MAKAGDDQVDLAAREGTAHAAAETSPGAVKTVKGDGGRRINLNRALVEDELCRM